MAPNEHILVPDERFVVPDTHILAPAERFVAPNEYLVVPNKPFVVTNEQILAPHTHIVATALLFMSLKEQRMARQRSIDKKTPRQIAKRALF